MHPVILQAYANAVAADRRSRIGLRSLAGLRLRGLATLRLVALVATVAVGGVPVTVAVRVGVGVLLLSVKLAVTARAWFMVTTQLPVPVHAPLQPAKVEPVAAVAVRVITLP